MKRVFLEILNSDPKRQAFIYPRHLLDILKGQNLRILEYFPVTFLLGTIETNQCLG